MNDQKKPPRGRRLEPPKNPTGKGGIIWHKPRRGLAFVIIGAPEANKPKAPEPESGDEEELRLPPAKKK